MGLIFNELQNTLAGWRSAPRDLTLAENATQESLCTPRRITQLVEMLNNAPGSAEWQRTMGFLLKRIALILFAAVFLASGHFAAAGNPIGDFFKRLGNSIAHPQNSPPPRRTGQKNTTGKKQSDSEKVVPPDAPPRPSVPPAPTPTPTQPPVRTAGGIPPTKGLRRDMPYGIPVPNRPGLVTSPYAPKSGYVDVRGFPSGTEVKDPYTGKVFLTP